MSIQVIKRPLVKSLRIAFSVFFIFFAYFWIVQISYASAPVIQSLSPRNAIKEVDPLAQLSITFDQSVVAGSSGNITVKKLSDDSVWDTIWAYDTTRVRVSGATVTIKPHHYFMSGIRYYVEIDNTCFKNGSDESFLGISDSYTWRFTITPNIKVVQISAGCTGSMLLKSNGTVYAWGDNSKGGIGDNTTTDRHIPVQVHGLNNSGFLTDIVKISSGGDYQPLSFGSASGYAIKSDGTVLSWGNNDEAQLGDNTTTQRLTPVRVLDVGGSGYLSGMVDIVSRCGVNVLALKNNGTVYFWGNNYAGTSGDNTTDKKYVPVQVHGTDNTGNLENAAQISIGITLASAVTADGNLYSWGRNTSGELGDNTTTDRFVPVQVLGVNGNGYLTNVIRVTISGDNGQHILKNDGTVYRVGEAGGFHSHVPVQMHGVNDNGFLTGIKELGQTDNAAIGNDGTVYCWGYGDHGVLGNNDVNTIWAPTQVLGVNGTGYLQNITDLRTGWHYTDAEHMMPFQIALANDGTVYSWGYNGSGQLGDGTTTERHVPVCIGGQSSVQVSPGRYFYGVQTDLTCYVTLNGCTFSGVSNGAYTLQNGTDYTWDGNRLLVFKASYLSTLPAGDNMLTVDTGSGIFNPSIFLTVSKAINWTKGSSVNQSFTIPLTRRNLSGISNRTSNTNLTNVADYTWNGVDSLVLNASYLNTLPVGDNPINIGLSDGETYYISICIRVSASDTFSQGSPADKSYTIALNNRQLSSVSTNNGNFVLTSGTDYTWNSATKTLVLKAGYLSTLPIGQKVITLNMTGEVKTTITIDVTN